MTVTIETITDTTTDAATDAVDELIQVDPGVVIIGANVRDDVYPDAREFAQSIKTRGVLEAITGYRDEGGRLVAVLGQRRTVVAAKVGTPTGTVPFRVTARPNDVDRITDQMTENIHRAAMHDSEILAGVEQLALAGVSAAQIAKRTAIKRSRVDAALTVVGSESTRERLATHELTLDAAAIFAEFEHDPQATETLNNTLRRGQSLEHRAQELRDKAAEAAVLAAEIERLRAEGLPVLDAEQAADVRIGHRFDRLVTDNGEAVPEDQWPNVPGAAVVVVEDWVYPELDENTPEDELPDEEVEAVRVFVPLWVCTDPEAAGLHDQLTYRRTQADARSAAETEADAEAKRVDRRRVIENNKNWRSAQTVRREWLTTFVTRKTPPKGAETLIAEAVLSGHHTLTKAMEQAHPMLFTLLGVETTSGYYGPRKDMEHLLSKPRTPKAATLLTLNAVLAAWEKSADTHTWRNPTAWDGRIMSALIEWGYEASEVEKLLLPDYKAATPDNAGKTEAVPEAVLGANGDVQSDTK